MEMLSKIYSHYYTFLTVNSRNMSFVEFLCVTRLSLSCVMSCHEARCPLPSAHPLSVVWKVLVLYMSRMAGKFSGFLSKKYSGTSTHPIS